MGAVVATVLIAMGVVLLAQLMTDQKVSEKRLDHRVSGEQVLVDTATFYQNGEFDAIWGL